MLHISDILIYFCSGWHFPTDIHKGCPEILVEEYKEMIIIGVVVVIAVILIILFATGVIK